MKTPSKINIDKLLFVTKKFSLLRNPDRIRILDLLQVHQVLTVTQITNYLGMDKADLSHNLNLLRKYGILSRTRENKFHYYSINYNTLELIIRYSEELSESN